MKKIKAYFDYAATTPVDKQVLKAMLPYFSEKFGNPASLHEFGRVASQALENSRQIVAKAINASPNEIYFTGSATESNNWALKGVMAANQDRGKHLIISAIEHDCVLNTAKYLAKHGYEVSYLKVDRAGSVDLDELQSLIRQDTVLVSVIHANNEIGTIQPIAKIGEICHDRGVFFHTDAAQSFTKLDINVEEMNVDLLTASSHKIYGPKGVAMLYVKKGVAIEPLLQGGGQERNMRSSTSNVAGIVGFAKAVEVALQRQKSEHQKLTQLRDKIIKTILAKVPNSYLNGHAKNRLSNNINIRFDFVEGESVLMQLDAVGIAVSTGSACSSPKLDPSHVLLACGLKHEQAHGSIRISLGRQTTGKEVSHLLKSLPLAVAKIRSLSPFKK